MVLDNNKGNNNRGLAVNNNTVSKNNSVPVSHLNNTQEIKKKEEQPAIAESKNQEQGIRRKDQ